MIVFLSINGNSTSAKGHGGGKFAKHKLRIQMHSKNAFFCCLDIYKTNNFGFTLSLNDNFFIINNVVGFNLLVYNGLFYLAYFWRFPSGME